ncbi:hypothetical protein PGN35_011175 [Nodosilinea sp. PGN35]|uniref:hypothetical protein n=1 Tax=Nodosilinea sp. PGN35 TaxID=3020489 RepID=UPI0023B2F8B1|nr:hypothetical protein [Nodosilinea sp. TSF1-S3]MDF0366408.1 hypothetical protein [Nodosilinea sp. TSF1-S3]
MGTTQGVIRKVTGLGRRVVAQVVTLGAIALLAFGVASCAKPVQPTELLSEPTPQPNRLTGQIAEVSPPETLETLKQIIDAYTPQVRILSPRPGEVLDDTTASVRLQVRGLPLFKDDTYDLGPHLHLFLDNEPYRAVYDLAEPVTFEGLSPGTHTLRVFASRPWHESFKNQGAFDQRTFHVVAPTPQNELNAKAPLLTYSRPQASYGAEPIMLDFYLTNAPLHMSAQAEANDDLHDWRIRCTVNDQSFVFDQWQPLWLKGFKPGRNWVQLELIDESGNPIDNRFNNTVRIIDYQPGGSDTLSRLVRGELGLKEVAGIIDPTYVPPAPPAPEPTAESEDLEPEAASGLPAADGAPEEPPTPEPEPVQPEPVQPEPLQPKVVAPAPPESVQELPPPAEPEATSPGSAPPVPAEPEEEDLANPSVLPKQSTESEAAGDNGLPNAEDRTEASAAEDSPPFLAEPPEADLPEQSSGPEPEVEDTIPSPEPFVPPVLPQPEAPPELAPVRPPAAQETSPRGLLNRFNSRLKQWREQTGQPAPPAPLPPTPEDTFGNRPEDTKPVPDAGTNPAGDEAPETPRSPAVDGPRAPSLDAEPPQQSPPQADADEPVKLPRIEEPRDTPRSPLVPEVRPFI